MKGTEDECKVFEERIKEEQSVFLHGGKWTSAEQGKHEEALEAFLPFRNIPYKAQLSARSTELDQTLDDIVKRSKDAFAKDIKYAKKPPIKKPPLEDIIPMIPNVGYERNVTLGLEKDATGKIHAGIRVVYEKDGNIKQFLLPMSDCSTIAPQIVKAAEATAAFLTQQRFGVYDGVGNCRDIYGLKFTMNEIGEIIMTLVLVIENMGNKDSLKKDDSKACLDESGVAPKAEDNTVNGEKVEHMIFFLPGGFKKPLREFFFKSDVISQIKEHLEKYAPSLKNFVEENRAAVVGVYITWHDAESPPEWKPTAHPWYHVAGSESVTETINSVKLDLFPHLENFHPSRTQIIPTIVNTVVDGLCLQKESSLVLLLSEYYFLPSLISQKCKQAAVLAAVQESLKSYLKEKIKHNILFVSFPRANSMKLFHYAPRTPGAVIHWGQFKDDEAIKRVVDLNPQKRPKRIAWVIDAREDNANSDANKCLNADLLERNHIMLYPYYTLERVVGVDVGPQKSERLTLVAFYERYDGEIRMNPGQKGSRGTKEGGPKAEIEVLAQQVPVGHNAKRKAPDQQGLVSHSDKKKASNQRGPAGPSERDGVRRDVTQKERGKGGSNHQEGHSGSKRPRRGGSPRPLRRGSSRRFSSSRVTTPMGFGGRPMNPWGNNSPTDRPLAAPSQAASAVLSQLTDVIGKQLLFAQMNSALQLTSESDIRDMRPNRGTVGDYGGFERPSQENYDFPPPPRQIPTVLPHSSARDISLPGAQEDYRSAVRGDVTRKNLRSTSWEDIPRDGVRSGLEFARDSVRSGQEFTRDDFWSTPLKDFSRDKFRTASPTRENLKSSSVSRDTVRSVSIAREDFPRNNYRHASREDFTPDYLGSAEQEELRRASPTLEDVRCMSPDREDYTHRNFRRDTRDDFARGNYGSAARADSRSNTRGGIVRDNFRIATRENSPRSHIRRVAEDDSWGTARDDWTLNNIRREVSDYTPSEALGDYRSAAQNLVTRSDFDNTTREGFTSSDSRKAARDEFTHSDFRRTAWEGSRSAAHEDLADNDTRRAVGDDFKRADRDDVTSTAKDYLSTAEFREDLTRDEFFGNSFVSGPCDTSYYSTRNTRFSDYSEAGYGVGIRYPGVDEFSDGRDARGGDFTRRN